MTQMLHRPYCLLELLTAVDNKVPIVGVNIATPRREDGYDFEAASQFLLELDSQLEAATPGATKILAEHGYGAVDVLCHDGDGALHVVEALERRAANPDEGDGLDADADFTCPNCGFTTFASRSFRLTCAKCGRCRDELPPRDAYLLTGARGAGKSVALAQIVTQARARGWLR